MSGDGTKESKTGLTILSEAPVPWTNESLPTTDYDEISLHFLKAPALVSSPHRYTCAAAKLRTDLKGFSV